MTILRYLKNHSRQVATVGFASLVVAAAGFWVPLVAEAGGRLPIAVVEIEQGQPVPVATIDVKIDADGRGTVEISAENFRFTDLCLGRGTDRTPVGHAHVYVDNRKVAVATSPRVDIGQVPAGDFQIAISLHDTTHRFLVADGQPVIASRRVMRSLAMAR